MGQWDKNRLFCSHSSKDAGEISELEDYLDKSRNIKLFLSELEKLDGKELLPQLKFQMENCGAVLLYWTENTDNEKTRDIINYELGLARALNLPIFIFSKEGVLPWYVDQLVKYHTIKKDSKCVWRQDKNAKDLREVFDRFVDTKVFQDNVSVEFPKEKYLKRNKEGEYVEQSDNHDIVKQKNAELVIEFPADYPKEKYKNNIFFQVCNNLKQVVRDFRLYLDIPKGIEVSFDEGDVEGRSMKTDNFWMRLIPSPKGPDWQRVKLLFPSLPVDEKINFELGVIKINLKEGTVGEFCCSIQGDNIIKRTKRFKFYVMSEDGKLAETTDLNCDEDNKSTHNPLEHLGGLNTNATSYTPLLNQASNLNE